MADNKIYERNLKQVRVKNSQAEMATVYVQKLKEVEALLEKDGPLYATWIYLQIGLSNPLIFNSATNDPAKNLIADLVFNKTGTGVTNSFTLTIHYDPFNMGQNDAELVEELDERMATAMAGDWNDANKTMRGKIQYGYNTSSDSDLVSPCYEFYITNITSNVKMDSGITTYKIEGCSTLAIDCDFTADFPRVENKPLLEVIEQVLFKWYGDNSNKPPHIADTETANDNQFNYRIDIPDELYNNCVTITAEAQTGVQPIQYCLDLLDKNPLTQAEKDSKEFEDLSALSYSQKPRYALYITDEVDMPTIHVIHIKASSKIDENGVETATEENMISLDYTYTWGLQQTNIVTGWSPMVDLKLYLIQKSNYLRYARLKNEAEKTGNTDLVREYRKKLIDENTEFDEFYDAEIQTVGIPADPPLGAEVIIKPRILNAESRTAGVYSIRSCVDEISTSGLYTTTLSLFRIRSLTGKTMYLTKAQQEEYENAKAEAEEEQRKQDELLEELGIPKYQEPKYGPPIPDNL